MRTFILSSIILLSASVSVWSASARQDDERRFLDPSLVPAEAATPRDFVPRGWKTETDEGVVMGDLNGDGAADAVLRLVEDMPVKGAGGVYNTRHRALVILLAKPGGGYTRAAVATKLLGCTLCAGALGDPKGRNIKIEIKDGVLNVDQRSGAREVTDLTQRFRHDAASGRFQLIGEDVNTHDRSTGAGKGTSTNFLTGVRLTVITSVVSGGRKAAGMATTSAPRATRFIEDVDYEKQ
jgi:hypothetical protein